MGGRGHAACHPGGRQRLLGGRRRKRTFFNLTGADFDELASKASSGTPVLVWTTLDFEDPCFDEPLEANSFYDLEHCVVLLGVEGHRACIMDPTQGYVTVNYSWFKCLYEQCGSMALAIA